MKNRITIGRSYQSDIRVDERWDTVSNEHAEVEMAGDGLLYYDHSSNGTLINGQKVHNTNVGIYPGDRIMLAGVYELEWNVINQYFPAQHRPTVTRNIRGEEPEIGRKTVQLNPSAPQRDIPHPSASGRKTEQFSPYSKGGGTAEPVKPEVKSADYGQANTYSQADIDKAMEKWNWGAFFCSWLWAVAHKVYWPLAILILMNIPYAGPVCSLCLCVYLGLKGSRMAWNSGKYRSFEAYKEAQHKWAVGGVVWFAFSLAVSVYLVYTTMSIF